MSKVKGCPNLECELHKKHTHFNKKDNYCSHCGTQLQYVCKNKKCYTFLEETDGKYCLKCQAEIDDRNDAIKDGVAKVGSAAVALGGIAFTKGGDIVKVAGKFVKK